MPATSSSAIRTASSSSAREALRERARSARGCESQGSEDGSARRARRDRPTGLGAADRRERRAVPRLMKNVLYLSHATPEVYSIIRDSVPTGFELVTLEQNSDDERRQKIAECEVVIVAATALRKADDRRRNASRTRAPPGRRLAGHDRSRGAEGARHTAGVDTRRHDDRRRRARGAADPGGAEAAAICRQRAAAGPLSHQRSAAGIARAPGA